MTSWTRRSARWLALLLVLALWGPVGAEARRWSGKAIWGPAQVDGRSQFPLYRHLGVGIWESGLSWRGAAARRPAAPTDPRDPAYEWPASLDYAVAQARRYHIRVAINISQAPGWANGGRPPEWAPRHVRDYARFAQAAARHYRGVRLWIVWSEASRAAIFRPLSRNSPAGPRRYARLLDAAYVRLKRVSRRNRVIGGNTFTTGDMPALRFLKWMRLPGGRRPRMDLYGHNPFTRRRPRLSDPPLGYGFVDFGTLDTLSHRLDRYWRGRRRKLRLFLSEFSVPMHKLSHTFNFYESEHTAASWLRSAFRIARHWHRIYGLGWYQLYDEPPRPMGDETVWGLISPTGRRRPVYYAYLHG